MLLVEFSSLDENKVKRFLQDNEQLAQSNSKFIRLINNETINSKEVIAVLDNLKENKKQEEQELTKQWKKAFKEKDEDKLNELFEKMPVNKQISCIASIDVNNISIEFVRSKLNQLISKPHKNIEDLYHTIVKVGTLEQAKQYFNNNKNLHYGFESFITHCLGSNTKTAEEKIVAAKYFLEEKPFFKSCNQLGLMVSNWEFFDKNDMRNYLDNSPTWLLGDDMNTLIKLTKHSEYAEKINEVINFYLENTKQFSFTQFQYKDIFYSEKLNQELKDKLQLKSEILTSSEKNLNDYYTKTKIDDASISLALDDKKFRQSIALIFSPLDIQTKEQSILENSNFSLLQRMKENKELIKEMHFSDSFIDKLNKIPDKEEEYLVNTLNSINYFENISNTIKEFIQLAQSKPQIYDLLTIDSKINLIEFLPHCHKIEINNESFIEKVMKPVGINNKFSLYQSSNITERWGSEKKPLVQFFYNHNIRQEEFKNINYYQACKIWHYLEDDKKQLVIEGLKYNSQSRNEYPQNIYFREMHSYDARQILKNEDEISSYMQNGIKNKLKR